MADTLLLVDDDVSVLRAIGDYFERNGYEVWRAGTGEQAMETYRRERPDVVLLDLHLRDADGLMVLERLRREGANVILVTSQGDIETAVKAMQLAVEQLPPDSRHHSPTDRRYQAQSLSEVERRHIERTLRHHGGNRTRAALELGISRATLINKIKQYGMSI
jgi:DNA-binding NtrC family response regulator